MGFSRLVKLALDYCTFYHQGEYRKGSNLPYHTHPKKVAEILVDHGYSDDTTVCIALLHDLVENAGLEIAEVKERFNYEICNGVHTLSKNTIKEDDIKYQKMAMPGIVADNVAIDYFYKSRIGYARDTIKRVKIADMVHNTEDLISLSPRGREKKLKEAEEFYIPMGWDVAPLMVQKLIDNIQNYKDSINSKNPDNYSI